MILSEVKVMKEVIHPDYQTCTVKDAGDMKVDICSKCHPFYTGKQKLVDTGGRVERFNKRFAKKG